MTGVRKDGQYTLIPENSVPRVRSVDSSVEIVVPSNAQTVLAEFLEWHQDTFHVGLPTRLRGRLAKGIKALLETNYPVGTIKWGLAAWCSYLAEDPKTSPVELERIVYCLHMKEAGFSDLMTRARVASGLPSAGGKRSARDRAAINNAAVDSYQSRRRPA